MGELFISTGGWVFEPTEQQLRRTAKKNAALAGGHRRQDADGVDMCLISQPTVFCALPAWQGQYPKGGVKKQFPTYFVPVVECQKCEHFRRKVGRSRVICWLTHKERGEWGRKHGDE